MRQIRNILNILLGVVLIAGGSITLWHLFMHDCWMASLNTACAQPLIADKMQYYLQVLADLLWQTFGLLAPLVLFLLMYKGILCVLERNYTRWRAWLFTPSVLILAAIMHTLIKKSSISSIVFTVFPPILKYDPFGIFSIVNKR